MVILSFLFPLGMSTGLGLVLWVDIWPGILSLIFVDELLGADAQYFAGTLATTIVQGTLLNIIIFIIMSIVYAVQRLFMTPPPESSPRGFDVVMPAR